MIGRLWRRLVGVKITTLDLATGRTTTRRSRAYCDPGDFR